LEKKEIKANSKGKREKNTLIRKEGFLEVQKLV
jgi:hypothetical protein